MSRLGRHWKPRERSARTDALGIVPRLVRPWPFKPRPAPRNYPNGTPAPSRQAANRVEGTLPSPSHPSIALRGNTASGSGKPKSTLLRGLRSVCVAPAGIRSRFVALVLQLSGQRRLRVGLVPGVEPTHEKLARPRIRSILGTRQAASQKTGGPGAASRRQPSHQSKSRMPVADDEDTTGFPPNSAEGSRAVEGNARRITPQSAPSRHPVR